MNKDQILEAIENMTVLELSELVKAMEKEAKELVDGAPKPVKENVGKAEAEELKGKLEEAGATVELK